MFVMCLHIFTHTIIKMAVMNQWIVSTDCYELVDYFNGLEHLNGILEQTFTIICTNAQVASISCFLTTLEI